ncbi:hypothetical protein ACFL5Q_07380, partial [Planctomycetota bacterium]
ESAMSIRVQCPGCKGLFQASDRLAGKQARCPHCSAAISVPSGATPETARAMSAERPSRPAPTDAASSGQGAVWYVQASDGSKHGPMTQVQLEHLVSTGRLDGFSRLRHQAWSDWKWAEDVFPQLNQFAQSASTGDDSPPAVALEPSPAGPSGESTAPDARVVMCPDCGNTVSRRASQCPHCGCPAKTGPGQSSAISGSRRRVAWIVGSMAVVLVIAAAGLGIGWWVWEDRPRVSQDENEAPAPAAETEPPAVPPPVPSAEIEAALQQAAAEEAKRLDAEFRTAHSAKKLIEQTQLSADLIQALAQGDLNSIPDTLPAELGPENSTPYQSLYDSLYNECLAYLRANVTPEEFTEQAVRDAVRRWEEEKRELLERQLTEELEKHHLPSGQLR